MPASPDSPRSNAEKLEALRERRAALGDFPTYERRDPIGLAAEGEKGVEARAALAAAQAAAHKRWKDKGEPNVPKENPNIRTQMIGGEQPSDFATAAATLCDLLRALGAFAKTTNVGAAITPNPALPDVALNAVLGYMLPENTFDAKQGSAVLNAARLPTQAELAEMQHAIHNPAEMLGLRDAAVIRESLRGIQVFGDALPTLTLQHSDANRYALQGLQLEFSQAALVGEHATRLKHLMSEGTATVTQEGAKLSVRRFARPISAVRAAEAMDGRALLNDAVAHILDSPAAELSGGAMSTVQARFQPPSLRDVTFASHKGKTLRTKSANVDLDYQCVSAFTLDVGTFGSQVRDTLIELFGTHVNFDFERGTASVTPTQPVRVDVLAARLRSTRDIIARMGQDFPRDLSVSPATAPDGVTRSPGAEVLDPLVRTSILRTFGSIEV